MRESFVWNSGALVLWSVAALATAGVALDATPATAETSGCVAQGGVIVCTFIYNGATGTDGALQTFKVPAGVTDLTIDAYGAQGGGDTDGGGKAGSIGGLGGHESTTIPVLAGQVFDIRVGGQPGGAGGGYNGGGASASGAYFGGGGASDVRPAGGALADRIVTAGGGGGRAVKTAPTPPTETLVGGGAGGGATGGVGAECDAATCGGGGTDAAGGAAGVSSGVLCSPSSAAQAGSFGTGGNGEQCTTPAIGGSGGGGGWYGGGGGGDAVTLDISHFPFQAYGITGSGGGGSGHIAAGTNQLHEQGVRSGDGLVTITYSGGKPPPPGPPSGRISCNVTGTITFKGPLRGTPSTKTISMKIATAGACDNSHVIGGKAPITTVKVAETRTLDVGSACSGVQFAPMKTQKIVAKWQGLNAKGKVTTVATNSLAIAASAFLPASVPASYASQSVTIAKAKSAFLGSTVVHGLLVAEDMTAYDAACQSTDGLTLLHVTGVIAVP